MKTSFSHSFRSKFFPVTKVSNFRRFVIIKSPYCFLSRKFRTFELS